MHGVGSRAGQGGAGQGRALRGRAGWSSPGGAPLGCLPALPCAMSRFCPCSTCTRCTSAQAAQPGCWLLPPFHRAPCGTRPIAPSTPPLQDAHVDPWLLWWPVPGHCFSAASGCRGWGLGRWAAGVELAHDDKCPAVITHSKSLPWSPLPLRAPSLPVSPSTPSPLVVFVRFASVCVSLWEERGVDPCIFPPMATAEQHFAQGCAHMLSGHFDAALVDMHTSAFLAAQSPEREWQKPFALGASVNHPRVKDGPSSGRLAPFPAPRPRPRPPPPVPSPTCGSWFGI